MKNIMFRKGPVLGIILLFVGAGIIPPIGGAVVEKESNYPISNGKTLYVGGSGPLNYTQIRDAIDDAVDGDTVFVYDDSSPYWDNLRIEKSINLIGEDRDTTVIDGGIGTVVRISADEVTLSGFTITSGSSSYGIRFVYSDHCTITGNIISNLGSGISLAAGANNNIITDNIFTDNDDSIFLSGSNRNTITNNTITGDTFGGLIDYSGIELRGSKSNIIKGNNIKSRDNGIYLYSSSWNTITGNAISDNKIGILLEYGARGNFILKNNFLDNEKDAYFTTSRTLRTNRWSQNYWNESLVHPKIIFGERIFLIPIGPWWPFAIEHWIPWFPEFDWLPAKEPYDI